MDHSSEKFGLWPRQLDKNNFDPISGGLWNPREDGPGSSGATCSLGVTKAQGPGWEVPAAWTCLYRPSLPRLLEADSKSMRSMNGSRRNSGSSLVSSSSASSNLSHLEEDTWILWGRIANEWEEWRRRKEKLLKVAGMVEVGGQLGVQQGQTAGGPAWSLCQRTTVPGPQHR